MPPAEYAQIQFTEMEAELREAVQGADEEWLKDPKAEGAWEWGPTTKDPAAAQQSGRVQKAANQLQKLAVGPVSDHLHSHLVATLALQGVDASAKVTELPAWETGQLSARYNPRLGR